MTRKEANGLRSYLGARKTRLTVAIGSLAVVAACLVIRHLMGTDTAQAQSPRQKQPRTSVARRPTAPRDDAAADGDALPPGVDAPSKAARRSRSTGSRLKELKVMAVVNAEDITRQDLANECMVRYGEDVLEQLINKHVIDQACQKRGIQITEQDVADEVARLASKFNLGPEQWLKMLEDERDIAPDKYRKEIVWPILALRALAEGQIAVNKDDMEKGMEAEFGEKVQARLITLPSREKAEQIRKQAVANPDNFGKLAKQHSDDSSSSGGGMIPAVRKYLGDEAFERVAFGLKEGEVSEVFQFGDKFVILKCEKKLPPTQLSDNDRKRYEQQLHDRIEDGKLRAAAGEIFQKLQADANVVKALKDPQLEQKMPGVAATINGQPISLRQLAEECLQRYGAEVLDGEINRRLLMQELKRRKKQVDQADVDREIARAADSYGFWNKDGTPNVDEWLKTVTAEDNVTVDLYIRDAVWPSAALKKLVTEQVQVTEEDLQKATEANYGERVQVLAIVVADQKQAQKVWTEARAKPSVEDFGKLAQEYSIEPLSRENKGQVPPVRKHGGQPLIEREAFALSEDDPLSGVIAVGDKWVILRFVGRTTPALDEVDENVKQELHKDVLEKKLRLAMSREFDRLKESAQIDNFLTGVAQPGKQNEQQPLFPSAQRPRAKK